MSSHELFDRAKWWLSQGVELVPIQTKSKALVKGYGSRSKHVTTEREAWLWFDKLQVNLGIVCGGLVGLACVDFDDAGTYDLWHQDPGQNLATLTEKTARGYHVFFTSEPLPSVLTAKVELKSSGVVIVAPSIHPSGKRYEITTPSPIAQLTTAQVTDHFPFVSEILNQSEPPPYLESPQTKSENSNDQRVTTRIKVAYPVSEEARKLTDLRGREGHYYGRCPFHGDTNPSFWVDDEAGIWACRSPSCPTNASGHKAHDVINLRAWAGHISDREAITQLASEVLPSWPSKPPR